jgi:hypothetical protein
MATKAQLLTIQEQIDELDRLMILIEDKSIKDRLLGIRKGLTDVIQEFASQAEITPVQEPPVP